MRKYWRTLVLLLLIALSLFLTFRILFFQTEEAEAPSNVTSATPTTFETNFEREHGSVFGPARIILYDGDQSYLIQSEEFYSLISQQGREARLDNFRDEGTYDWESYLLEADYHPHLVLSYISELPLGLLQGEIQDLDELHYDHTFNRVYIPRDGSNRLYFLNDKSLRLYSATLADNINPFVFEDFTQEDLRETVVERYWIGDKFFYLPESQVECYATSYLVERLPNSYYVTALFDSGHNIEVHQLDDSLRYNDYYSEMTINLITEILEFEGYRSANDGRSQTDQMLNDYRQLLNYERWNHPVRIEGFNDETGRSHYRRYIEGLPIFDEEGRDEVIIESNGTSLVYLRQSLEIAQTPVQVPSNVQMNLESGIEIIEEISQKNIQVNEIEDIRMGFEWQVYDESDRIVHFVPHWYVLYNEAWWKLEDLR